jgi:hypothetical protein
MGGEASNPTGSFMLQNNGDAESSRAFGVLAYAGRP